MFIWTQVRFPGLSWQWACVQQLLIALLCCSLFQEPLSEGRALGTKEVKRNLRLRLHRLKVHFGSCSQDVCQLYMQFKIEISHKVLSRSSFLILLLVIEVFVL